MRKYLALILLLLNLLPPTLSAAVAEEDEDKASEAANLLLKDEEPLKVQTDLPKPQRTVNLRSIQREVLTINLPDEAPEVDTEPVEE